MIEDEKGLETGTPMDTSDTPSNFEFCDEGRDFLTSLFECEDGGSDEKMIRYAEAIIDVQKLTADCLQSHLTEIVTNFVIHSQGSQKGSTDLADRIGFSELKTVSGSREEDAVDYLLASFVRAHRALNNNSISKNLRQTITTAKTALIDVFVMIQRGYLDDLLNSQSANLAFFKRLFEDTVTISFLQSLVEQLETDEETIADVFNPIFDLLRSAIIAQHFEENKDEVVQQILRVTGLLVGLKIGKSRPLSRLVASRADFVPSTTEKLAGREFGKTSYLGPFFDYGLISSGRRPNTRVFVGLEQEARGHEVNMEQKQYFNRISSVRTGLHQIMLHLASDAISRKSAVNWIANVINLNISRARTHFENSDVLDDHWMANFMAVMYILSHRIEINKIREDYPFRVGTMLTIAKETRINMDEAGALQFSNDLGSESVESENFSTVCFFLTIAAQHITFPPLITQINDYSRHSKDLSRKINALKEKLNSASSPAERIEIEEKIKFETEHWKMMTRHLLCVKTLLQDSGLMASALDFADKQLTLLVKALSPDLNLMGDADQFPKAPTRLFSAFPQYYLEDLFDIYAFAFYYCAPMLAERNTEWIGRLTVFFTNYHYMQSPFLVAKLIRVLTHIQQGPLWYHVTKLRIAEQLLLVRMIKFYSDFEDNGDFYEKFNVRGNIQVLLKRMEENAFYRSQFMNMAKECGAEFIRFANMVINDATWCIDESLSGLKSIHDVEKKMSNKEEWDRLTQEVRNQELSVYEEAKRKVSGWLETAQKNFELLLSITDNSPEPFVTAALGERLAAMLNHNLSQLTGNKCAELKVSNPRSYGWKPREFVTLIISIYLGLNVPEFVKYIAYDERTYTPTFFKNVIERLRKNQILSFSQLERFEHVAEAVQKEYEAKAELEEEYDDVPEEFKDPIMDAIMVDPVSLPSGHIMDRAVIERHLLSTPNNPFNRAPLAQNELVPEVELKARIEAWIAEKRRAKQ